jgi:hypothetical protein
MSLIISPLKIALFLAALLLFFVLLGFQWILNYALKLVEDVCREDDRQ